MIDISKYKPNIKYLTKDILRANNFRYIDGYYSYRFPVLKHKKEPTLWCNVYINTEDNYCGYAVTDSEFRTYHSFYNREYGKNKAVDKAEGIIKSQLEVFVKNKLLVVKGGNN